MMTRSGTFDARRAVRWGLSAGLVMVFTSSVGMLEAFDGRMVVDPILSLGYLALLWFVPVAGYRASVTQALEGMEAPEPGTGNLIAGLMTGAAAGAVLGLFTLLTTAVNLRDVFIKLSPLLNDLLTFGLDTGPGVILMFVIVTLLGLGGASFHLLTAITARRLVLAVEWVVIVALLERVFSQILRQIGLGSLVTQVYRQGGLRIWSAIGVAAITYYLIGRVKFPRSFVREKLTVPNPADRTRNTLVAAAIVFALFGVLPWLLGSLLSELLSTVGLFLLMGLGLNIVVGLAGLLDLGYVAFFAVGAYTAGVLTSPISPAFAPRISWWLAVPVVIFVSAIAGLLVGTPVIRMRGDYLAIVTLGFGEIVRILFLSDWLAPVFGGAQGIRQIPGIPLGVTTVSGANPKTIIYFAIGLVLLAAWVSWALQSSRIGRAWTAMREDETVAESMGIEIVKAKLYAFVVGAVFAGLAGALFAAKVGSIFPRSFALLVSLIILVVVIVGGMGSIPGVAVGAVVLIGVLGGPTQPGLLQEFAEFKLLIYGALLIYMMLQRPEGLLPSVRRSRELHQEEFLQDAWLGAGGEEPDEAAEAPV